MPAARKILAPRRVARPSAGARAFADYLEETRVKVDRWIEDALPSAETPPRSLHESMRYAVFPGGKRLRPALVLLACEAFGGEEKAAREAACAVELVHAYSLIHDDLPCMDDGTTRRGKPCVHRVYGEAGAVLAGDALLTEAFALLARSGNPGTSRSLVSLLAGAAGSRGMVGGQVEDLAAAGEAPRRETVERIHRLKTGALIAACFEMGAVCAGADERARARVRSLGEDLGLAFQIVDDLLDVTGSEKSLGKGAGQDAEAGKMTYPACLGLLPAKAEAQALAERARAKAASLGARRADRFEAVARFVVERIS